MLGTQSEHRAPRRNEPGRELVDGPDPPRMDSGLQQHRLLRDHVDVKQVHKKTAAAVMAAIPSSTNARIWTFVYIHISVSIYEFIYLFIYLLIYLDSLNAPL